MLWGAAHLPGLAAGLKKAGYRRQATIWVSVGKLATAWAAIRAFRAFILADDAGPPTPGESEQPGSGGASGDTGDPSVGHSE